MEKAKNYSAHSAWSLIFQFIYRNDKNLHNKHSKSKTHYVIEKKLYTCWEKPKNKGH